MGQILSVPMLLAGAVITYWAYRSGVVLETITEPVAAVSAQPHSVQPAGTKRSRKRKKGAGRR